MSMRPLVLVLASAVPLLAIAGVGFGDDEPAKPMSEMEMFQKAMQLAQPGEMHAKVLARFEGNWKAEGKMFTETMGEMPVTGASTNRWILGKRFIETRYEGPFMAGTFEGRAFMGYDNLTKTFRQVWIMTMATGMDVMKGTWDAEKQTMTWNYSMLGVDGKTYKKRDLVTFEGPDAFTTTSYATGPDGREYKEMALRYARAK